MGCHFTTFDVETFAELEIQPFQGRSLLTTDLAKILRRVPKKYRSEVAHHLCKLHI
mgnify:FL=1